MSSGQIADNLLTNCSIALQGFQFAPRQRARKPRVHDYSHYEEGLDFVVEAAYETPGSGQFYMTSDRRKEVKQGDYITFQKDSHTVQYRVEQVDYYQDASDMWIALLSAAPQLV
jgi:hypothetical protein